MVLIFFELMLVIAIALFFSTFSSPMLSAAFTFGLFVAGQFSADLKNFEMAVESKAAATIARGLYYILPNFAVFDVKSAVVHGQPLAAAVIANSVIYGSLYISALVLLAVVIFSRRDFK
jgi:Cu-processing system permease protein